ncbi:uncharacterized protein IWZ02DRAFT_135606 [Phyllosticta citriasiana]|uniref:uncharacterized protein n=1 Tax=Phyllosticta citriasiana TaxID=595635 RepID=UPI0030FDD352
MLSRFFLSSFLFPIRFLFAVSIMLEQSVWLQERDLFHPWKRFRFLDALHSCSAAFSKTLSKKHIIHILLFQHLKSVGHDDSFSNQLFVRQIWLWSTQVRDFWRRRLSKFDENRRPCI